MSNKLVVCPYDEAHKVKESRIQLHITKCRSNKKIASTFICPFNATHVLPMQEKEYHLSRCPDKGVLVRMMAPVNQNNPFKGHTAVPSYSDSILADTDEVWDIEEFDSIESSLPTKEAPEGAIVQPKPLSKPASRRQLYRELHQMPSDVGKRSESATGSVPRQPKQPSQAERTFVEEQVAGAQNLGLGRGKPPATRIAANIFSQQPTVSNAASAESNYSAAISGMKNLGLGRGVTNKALVNQPFLNDDDFPALGLGRGIAKNPRQEFKAPGSR